MVEIMRTLRSAPTVLVALILSSAPWEGSILGPRAAHAQDAAIEEARSLFDSGQKLYEKGEFAKAAQSFLDAYERKAFPAFLFNAAVCREALKENAQAVELLERYLKEDPKAADRAEVEKWIADLKAPPPPPVAATPGAEPAPGAEPTPGAAPATPPPEPRALLRTKGLTVIETYPEGATLRLDDAAGPEFGHSTWSGRLPSGKHTLHLELTGYKKEAKAISPPEQVQFSYYFFRLSADPEFGFLVVTSNLPDALIYLDGQPGVWGRVSSERNLKKGKHHITVVREGYQRKELDIDVQAGQLNTVPVQLQVAPVGYVRVRSSEATKGAHVQLDGKEVCAEVPCRFESPEGNHAVAIVEKNKKDFAKSLKIEKLTETTLSVKLADKPSRLGAIGYFLAAAAFVGGGVAAGLTLDRETTRLFGKQDDQGWVDAVRYTYFGVGGALGAVFLYLGFNEVFREKGERSTGSVETRDLSWVPRLSPRIAGRDYAGLAAAWRF